MKYVFDDGGREAAGYKGLAGDCVTRAVSIATEQDYQTVYDAMSKINANTRRGKRTVKSVGTNTARNGVYTNRRPFIEYMTSRGWEWVPCMGIGTGAKVHLRADELPSGRIICRVSRHMVAVIDGVIHDTHDPSRGGMRCVYGYWRKP